jgi:hypothetical protein
MEKTLHPTKTRTNHLLLPLLHTMPNGDISGTLAQMTKLRRDMQMLFQLISLSSRLLWTHGGDI